MTDMRERIIPIVAASAMLEAIEGFLSAYDDKERLTAAQVIEEVDALRTALALATKSMSDEKNHGIERHRSVAADILAEREKCAKVAENFTNAQHIAHDIRAGIFPRRSEIGEAISFAIRAQKGEWDGRPDRPN